jgi:hypothetical protein
MITGDPATGNHPREAAFLKRKTATQKIDLHLKS